MIACFLLDFCGNNANVFVTGFVAKEDNINETSSSDLEIQGIQGIGPTFRANNDEWGALHRLIKGGSDTEQLFYEDWRSY